jgi:hypothetical protein
VSLFAGAADAMVTGAALTAGTVALVAPILWLASPTLTDSGVSRTGIEAMRSIANRAKRRLIPRAHPQAPYPDPDAEGP